MRQLIVGFGLLIVLGLAGCSGGGSGGDGVSGSEEGVSAAPSVDGVVQLNAPLVDAGLDIGLKENEVADITPQISDSDGQVIKVEWVQTAGSSIQYQVVDSTLTLTAPPTGQPTSYEFKVTATDNDGLQASDEVGIHVGVPVSQSGVLQVPVLESALSASEGTAAITWSPTMMSKEFQDSVTYSIHASKDADFKPDPENLRATNLDALTAQVSGLEAGALYYFRVVASNGTEQAISEVKSTTVSSVEIKLNEGIKVVYASKMKTNLDDMEGDSLLLATEDNFNLGDIIYIEDINFAIKIIELDEVSNRAVLKAASLSDVFDQYQIQVGSQEGK